MNTHGHDHDAREREARDRNAREWTTQELARSQARAAAAEHPVTPVRGNSSSRGPFDAATLSSASAHDAGEAAYRRIAEALRHPPPVDLPPDFAARIARMAGQRAPAAVANRAQPEQSLPSGELERALVGVLGCVLALCALVAGGVYGPRMFAQVQAAIGLQGLQWTSLLAGCLVLSWSFEWLRRRAGHGGAMRPA